MDAIIFVGCVALAATFFFAPRPAEIRVRRRRQAVSSYALVRVLRGK